VTIRASLGDKQDTVILSVDDDGVGIPADVLPRIFEPQFSTRSTGTGLGLAIVQRVVRTWGGTIGVQSTLGEGTSVSVTLGVWDEAEGGGAG
jgi:signal transduction histidine kinase